MPPREESLRHTGEWVVVCERPDICMTPISGSLVPVPYIIVSRGQDSDDLASKTKFTKKPVFHYQSYTQRVVGNEPGTAGGIISGVNCGVCYPIDGSPSVNVEGCALVRHDDAFSMNAASYGAAGNTVGYAVWMESPVVELSDSVPWYKRMYDAAKERLDKINNEFKKAEREFGQSVKKILNTDPRQMNQSLGEAASQFGDTIKGRGSQFIESVQSIPERASQCIGEHGIAGCAYEYGEGLATGVAKGPPEAIGKFLDNVANGDMGKALGEVTFDLARSVVGEKGTEMVGLSRSATREVNNAQSDVWKAKDRVKATQKKQKSNNKALKKTGGRIKGSKKQKAAKRATREALKEKKRTLQDQNRANQSELQKAKTRLEDAKANPYSHDYGPMIELPNTQECPDIVDGKAQLYIGGPCRTP